MVATEALIKPSADGCTLLDYCAYGFRPDLIQVLCNRPEYKPCITLETLTSALEQAQANNKPNPEREQTIYLLITKKIAFLNACSKLTQAQQNELMSLQDLIRTMNL